MAGASTFWGLFTALDIADKMPWSACRELTDNSREFTLRNLQRRGRPSLDVFTLTFTCALRRLPHPQHAQHAPMRSIRQYQPGPADENHVFFVQQTRSRPFLLNYSHTKRSVTRLLVHHSGLVWTG